MPPLPWTKGPAGAHDGECVVMRRALRPEASDTSPGLVRHTSKIRRQLAEADGLVGYSVSTALPRRTFYTLSAWATMGDLARCNRADPRRESVLAVRPSIK